VRELLTRKVAGIPVWIVSLVAVLGLAWWLHSRGAAQQTASSDTTGATGFPEAVPMSYSSDTFVNVQQPSSPLPTAPPHWGGNPPAGYIGTTPAPTPTPPPKTSSVTYVVKSGDTLTAIAAKMGTTVSALYTANKSLIEQVAKQHGFSSSGSGHWIFPGEKLVIPK